MADSYRMARFKASLLPKPPPPLKVVAAKYTAEEADALLMKAVTMEEIRQTAGVLAMTFREAYRRREALYVVHYHIR